MLGFTKQDVVLTFNLARLQILDRYLGSSLGSVWAIVNPLFMLAIFTFVFGFVYKAKLPGAESTLSYAIWLISGYGPWLAISEGITASANSVTGNAGMVKNMLFRTEVLPIASALASIVPLAVSMAFLVALLVMDGNAPGWEALMVLLAIVIQFALVIAIGFFTAAITPFARDFGIALPNLLMMLLFLSPIFYPLESMPRILRLVSLVNPFYLITEGYRQPLIYHRLPSLAGLVYVAVLSAGLAYVGLLLFRRVKGHFNSVL